MDERRARRTRAAARIGCSRRRAIVGPAAPLDSCAGLGYGFTEAFAADRLGCRRCETGTEAEARMRDTAPPSPPVSLWTLFLVFLRIAATSFGGFMAMISVVQNVLVERRKLITPEQMLDGISLATLLPGPVAVNVVAYCGYLLRGGPGGLVSAFAAVLPAFLLMLVLSAAYFAWGSIPAVSRLFMGFMPAVAAVILAAAWNMGRKSIASAPEWAIAAIAAAALLAASGFFSTVAIIVGGGVAGWMLFRRRPGAPAPAETAAPAPVERRPRSHAALLLLSAPGGAVPWWSVEPALVAKLLAVFGAMSVMLFGGGYVFIPLMQQVVVDGEQWVTRQEFIDGIAMGQVTPGPILVSAAFIGYKVAGIAGAFAATVGIFAPPALLMVSSSRVLARIKRSAAIQAALRGVRPAVIGMIAAAAVVIGRAVPLVWVSVLIFGLALYAVAWRRIDVVWVIPPAGLAGVVLY